MGQLRGWLLWLLIPFLAGCWANSRSGPSTYLLPWANEPGHYSLQEITLTTLDDPYQLSGQAAKIYFGSELNGRNFDGEPARPRLLEQSGVFYPADRASILAVTAYAHYEHMFKKDQELGVSAGVGWPRQVSVDSEYLDENLGMVTRNAEYIGIYDVTRVAPHSGDGIPVALNGGVLAHENFHAYFDKAVSGPVRRTYPFRPKINLYWPALNGGPLNELWLASQWKSDHTNDDDPDEWLLYNLLVLRAWDEGLADYFGYFYAKDPQFMAASFKEVAPFRSVEGFYPPIPSIESLSEKFYGVDDPDCIKVCQSYTYGTFNTRFLLDFQKSTGLSDEAIARSIKLNLPRLGKQVLEAMARGEHLPFGMVWDVLLSDESKLANESGCPVIEYYFNWKQVPRSEKNRWAQLCKSLGPWSGSDG